MCSQRLAIADASDANDMKDVTVSAAQIRHLRDTLVRADSSFVSAKNRCLEIARSLHTEQIAVRDAIRTIDMLANS